ncbi:MAG: hypothetical protein J0G36_05850 [Afipia sp.]|nr:hypothetical protein [Afipia sp.]
MTALTVCAALVSLPALAGPVEMPNRKPGLWEVKVNAGAQMPAMTMQQCTDASTDKDMASTFSPMAKEMCAKQDMQKTATGLVIESTCTVSGVTSTSRTEIVGDFNSAYTVKVVTKGSGKIPDSVTTMEAKWMGACKADQKPGDIVMPGGMKMNIKDMQSMTGARPKQ